MNALAIDQISKAFGQVRAVDNLSATVPKGCIYGFLGPNGAGKTTTIRMIMDIIRPDSGQISINGSNSTVSSGKKQLGYLPEERGLYRKMTVERILSYFASIKGVPNLQLSGRVNQWLKKIDLAGWAGKKVEELSRGMHQKLQFAVTCINEPDLMILDEPFSGLDPVNLDMLKNIILEMRDNGKTIIFSTHIMHEAQNLCDYILLINKGRPVIDGLLDDICSSQISNSVILQLNGDATFIKQLPIVADVQQNAREYTITLNDNVDPQLLLKELIDRVAIKSFEIKKPSLHEIFVNIVEQDQMRTYQ